MSEHKLLDDIADSVAKNQDEIAEICQGIYGKIKLNELKPKRYNITNSKKMLYDMLRDTKTFYSSIKGRELTGARSVVEAFMGEINKFIYLMEMCIKEDIKRNITNLNENKMHISEKLLRETIKNSIKKVLNEDIANQNVQQFLEEFESTMGQTAYSVEMGLKEYKREIEIFKQIIPQMVERIQSICGQGNVTFDFDHERELLLIHIDLPSVKGFSEEGDDYTRLENEIWNNIEGFKKYVDFYFILDDVLRNGQNVYQAHIEFNQLPKFTFQEN